jgi:hypothetical protein
MSYEEYLKECKAPDEADLDARQQELLKQIEFCALMRQMWGDDEPR